jgi:hypothetical protein
VTNGLTTGGALCARNQVCRFIDSISGASLRSIRASAAAESTVDGRGKERGRNARDLGSCEPSLQTALGVHQISGEVGGESEQFAGIALDRFVEPFRGAPALWRRVNGNGELDTLALKPARVECHTNADWTSSRESVSFWPLGLTLGWLRCRRDSRERPAQDIPTTAAAKAHVKRRVRPGAIQDVGSTARRCLQFRRAA